MAFPYVKRPLRKLQHINISTEFLSLKKFLETKTGSRPSSNGQKEPFERKMTIHRWMYAQLILLGQLIRERANKI